MKPFALLLFCALLAAPLTAQVRPSAPKKTKPQGQNKSNTTNMRDIPFEPVLPYAEIPPAPENYTAETVVARMVDGLGFRYYWATEGLRPEDLDYRPSENARTCEETLEHIHGLSEMVVNAVQQQPNLRGEEKPVLSFAEKRRATLQNLKTTSDVLRSGEVQLEDCNIVFQSPDRTSEYPFWNNLNGPLADALWHTGQIVSFRRASGNPFNSKVSVFSGKVRE